jgi:putative ABC transport system permease protein
MDHFQQQTGDSRWGGVRLFLKDRSGDLESQVRRLRHQVLEGCARGYLLEVTSGVSLRREILRIFDETFAITTVLLLIALVIAALGISTTLMVLVLERRAQLNTLLAVGAGKGQVRWMIFWEALVIVVVGSLIGLLGGLLLSVILIYVINRQSFGWTFLFMVNWKVLLMSFPIILSSALTAVIPASRTAFRQPPAVLLREE